MGKGGKCRYIAQIVRYTFSSTLRYGDSENLCWRFQIRGKDILFEGQKTLGHYESTDQKRQLSDVAPHDEAADIIYPSFISD